MRIYCMRHGEALEAAEDKIRPLSDHGVQDVKKVANFLHESGIHIPHVIHSPRLRAKQTAEIMGAHLAAEKVVECPHGLDAEDSVDDMVIQINSWQTDTLLVGHMPFMEHLAAELLTADRCRLNMPFQVASIACLHKLSSQRWAILWSISPAIIPVLD